MVDYWHIDTRDNLDVFSDIDRLSLVSSTPVDLHIISDNPNTFLPYIQRENIRRIAFQLEEIKGDFQFPKIENKEIGLAICIDHPTLQKTIQHYQHQVDFILLMMTTPGISGGKFDKNHFSTIIDLAHTFPEIQWCIDGGVNHEISYILRLIGIQSVVIGSYLLNHENMAQAILQIKRNHVRSEYMVRDFCISTDKLPLVDASTSVIKLLSTIQHYQLGMAFFVDDSGRFIGIITNADIRKVLIEGKFDYEMKISHFVNTNPKFIYDDTSTTDMIEYIQKINFPILVLPILDKERTLKGAISFHKLLKQE